MNKFFTIIAIAAAFTLSACGKKGLGEGQVATGQAAIERAAVTPALLASQWEKARANAKSHAMAYLAENPRFNAVGESGSKVAFEVVGHTDSTISAECPQGDGWASATASANTGERDSKGRPVVLRYSLTCSTFSPAIGCYLTEDFKAKANLVKQDGVCRTTTEIPFPLPATGAK